MGSGVACEKRQCSSLVDPSEDAGETEPDILSPCAIPPVGLRESQTHSRRPGPKSGAHREPGTGYPLPPAVVPVGFWVPIPRPPAAGAPGIALAVAGAKLTRAPEVSRATRCLSRSARTPWVTREHLPLRATAGRPSTPHVPSDHPSDASDGWRTARRTLRPEELSPRPQGGC